MSRGSKNFAKSSCDETSKSAFRGQTFLASLPSPSLRLNIEAGSGRVVKKSQGGWWTLTFRDRSFVLMTAHMVGDQRCDNNYYYYYYNNVIIYLLG